MSFTDIALDTPITEQTPMMPAPSTALPAPKKRYSRKYLEYFQPADVPMEIKFPDFSYPQSREEAGKHFWSVLHNAAATYPDRPSHGSKLQTRQMLKGLIRSFPCENCREHAKAYLKENLPVLKNRRSFVRWACEFHNTVNRHLGKPLYRCDTMYNDKDEYEECDTCKVMPMRKNEGAGGGEQQHIHDHMEEEKARAEDGLAKYYNDPEQYMSGNGGNYNEMDLFSSKDKKTDGLLNDNIKDKGLIGNDTPSSAATAEVDTEEEGDNDNEEVSYHFNQIRDSSEAIIEELCQRAGIPAPEIIFRACPSHPDNSCTQVVMGDGEKEAVGRLYLNPMQYSPRTIVHEFKHWYEAVRGDSEKFKDEKLAEEFAHETIGKYFPNDEQPAEFNQNQPIEEAQDKDKNKHVHTHSSHSHHSHPHPHPTHSFGQMFGNKSHMEGLKKYLDPSFKWDFERVGSRKEPEHEEFQQFEGDGSRRGGGLMSWFDNIYGFAAANTGISVQALNEANTPEIIGYSINALQSLALSPFGQIFSSVLSGLALYGAGIMSGDIEYRDRRMMFEIGSHQLWSFIALAGNSTAQQLVMTQAQAAGTAISQMNLQGVISALTSK